ncbi:MAG: hypothetical protein IJX39_01345 [Clostridia bacterium]|nr:hypothetical protein [Clostridia bacterium]
MSDRYSKVFSLQENLYIKGSPAIIKAGALLLDTATDTVLAQLKFQNIATKRIKMLTVSLQPKDSLGRKHGTPITHQYLDITVSRDDMFGSQTPIRFPDNKTRSFDACILEIGFEDNTIWAAEVQNWSPLPTLIPLQQKFEDPDTVAGFRYQFGSNAQFVPQRVLDKWFCTCGYCNDEDEKICHHCKQDLQKIETANPEHLKQETELRRQNEASRKATEKANKRRKRNILITIIAISIIFIFFALFILPSLSQKLDFNKAVKLWEEGNHYEAVSILPYSYNREFADLFHEELEEVYINYYISGDLLKAETIAYPFYSYENGKIFVYISDLSDEGIAYGGFNIGSIITYLNNSSNSQFKNKVFEYAPLLKIALALDGTKWTDGFYMGDDYYEYSYLKFEDGSVFSNLSGLDYQNYLFARYNSKTLYIIKRSDVQTDSFDSFSSSYIEIDCLANNLNNNILNVIVSHDGERYSVDYHPAPADDQ